MADVLPPSETAEVDIIDDLSSDARCDQGFLRVRRLVLRNRGARGVAAKEFRYDAIERDSLDAVVMLIELDIGDESHVVLRSCLRPPVALRADVSHALLWELPAGLIEAAERARGDVGLRESAARETLEETGFDIAPDAFAPLGPPVYLSPGVIAERIHIFHADATSSKRGFPTEDGSPVEAIGRVAIVSLVEALSACRDGRIADAKTEMAIRRLAERRGIR